MSQTSVQRTALLWPARALLVGAALLSALPAPAADLPKRRSGLWEVTTGTPGQAPAPSGTICIDEKTDDLAGQLGQGALDCSKQDIRRDGDAWTIDSVCKLGDSTATTRARITGTFDTSYQVAIDATYDPPLMGMREGRAVVRARWTGACKPGQRAGDMTLPGGMTINILDAPAGAPRK